MKSYINRLLTNEAREYYIPIVDKIKSICPDMLSRKIPEANVQQAFVVDMVSSLFLSGDHILSVGCYEDTAYCSLLENGYPVFGIDPIIDGTTLHDQFLRSDLKYNIIFSTSVIEHVENDEQFIREICQMLKLGGVAILTTDFKDNYLPGDPLPNTDVRFYTKKDLEIRIPSILDNYECMLLGNPDWSGKPDFWYQGHNYNFATIVFGKKG